MGAEFDDPVMQHAVDTAGLATEVIVTGGVGTGSTRLTAFDAALQDAGIHDANLIRVSSVTPASAETRRPAPRELATEIEPGEYFPAVYAWEATDQSDRSVHAAIAGARLDPGHGINVEDHGIDEERSAVESRCRAMLEEMADRREAAIDGSPWMRYESTTGNEGSEWSAAAAAILYAR